MDSQKAPTGNDLLASLVNEILERTDRCVRIWQENDIAVVGTDNRDVKDVEETIACLLRPVPRAEGEARLRSVIACAEKRPKLLGKLKSVAAALQGDHPRARLRGKRHRQSVRLLTDELRGGLLGAVENLFLRAGASQQKSFPLASARGVVPKAANKTVRR